MSYYEQITEDFDRLTDERWTTMVDGDELPGRPDWINIYLVDAEGNKFKTGRELSSVVYANVPDEPAFLPHTMELYQNYI